MTAEYKNIQTDVREIASGQLTRKQLHEILQHEASSNELVLSEINATISSDDDINSHVFVYDTSTDSDGGAWRQRTRNTSWYNETLNTSTRGARREFPAVAIIVVNKDFLRIHDADDPGMPVWMQFDISGAVASGHLMQNQNNLGSGFKCTAMNGCVYMSGSFITRVDFVRDTATLWANGSGLWRWNGSIAQRNENYRWHELNPDTTRRILSSTVNHVAVHVMPGTPIDRSTGLPNPSIAIATGVGVNFINHDDQVFSSTTEGGQDGAWIAFTKDHHIITHSDVNYSPADHMHLLRWGGTALSVLRKYDNVTDPHTTYDTQTNAGFTQFVAIEDREIVGLGYHDDNYPHPTITKFDRTFYPTTSGHNTIGVYGYSQSVSQPRDMVAYINNTHNTGWIPGESVLATMCDTKAEVVGVKPLNNLISSAASSFDSIDEYQIWRESETTSTLTIDSVNGSNAAKFTRVDSEGQGFGIWVNTSPGQVYKAQIEVVQIDGPQCRPYLNAHDQSGAVLNQNGYGLGYMGTMVLTFRATTERTHVWMSLNAISSVVWFDDLRVWRHDNLLANTFESEIGFHNTWETGGNYAPVLVVHGTTFDTTGVRLYTAATGGDSYIRQTVNSKLGFHTISWDVVENNGGYFGIFVNGVMHKDQITTSGSTTYNAPIDTIEIRHRGGSDGDNGVINNIQLRPAEKQLTYGLKSHMSVHGELVKHPVAPGADMMGYSGWGTGSYLRQPLAGWTGLGTGEFCMQGWIKIDKSHTEAGSYGPDGGASRQDFPIISIGDEANNSGFHLHADLTSSPLDEYSIDAGVLGLENSFSGSDAGPPRDDAGRATFKADTWNHFMVIRDESGYMHVYANGVKAGNSWWLAGVETSPVDFDTRWTDPHLHIGTRTQLDGPADYFSTGVQLSMIRISKYVPNQQQIDKIVREERALFAPNAKAVVYGTQQKGVGIDYDTGTGLLHVLTHAGRSDFDGLTRVDHSAEIGLRYISATNGMIANL